MVIINSIYKNRFLDKNCKQRKFFKLTLFITYGTNSNIICNSFYIYNLDNITYSYYCFKNKLSFKKSFEYEVFNNKGEEIKYCRIYCNYP